MSAGTVPNGQKIEKKRIAARMKKQNGFPGSAFFYFFGQAVKGFSRIDRVQRNRLFRVYTADPFPLRVIRTAVSAAQIPVRDLRTGKLFRDAAARHTRRSQILPQPFPYRLSGSGNRNPEDPVAFVAGGYQPGKRCAGSHGNRYGLKTDPQFFFLLQDLRKHLTVGTEQNRLSALSGLVPVYIVRIFPFIPELLSSETIPCGPLPLLKWNVPR